MNKLVLSTIVFLLSSVANAQFFSFGFGDDFFDSPFQQRAPREQITKPEYDGDKEDMELFMKDNFKNPPGQREAEGTIIIACIIDEKGKVVETHIVQGLRQTEFNKEAQRVASKMKFKPGKRGKEKVKSRYDVQFPIRKGRLNFLNLKTTDV